MTANQTESPIKTLHVVKEVLIAAPADVVFETILEPQGPMKDMNMKLEPWPGGRWFRDLGNNTGHLWGHVQVIKPPKVLELVGPTMMVLPRRLPHPVSPHRTARRHPAQIHPTRPLASSNPNSSKT